MVNRKPRLPLDGLPLDEAAHHLAPRRLKMRAMNVQINNLHPIKHTTDPNIAMSQFLSLTRIALDNSLAANEPIWAMREWLLLRIQQQAFTISGIQTVPLSRGAIESIPAHFFDGRPKIHWNRSILENFGRRFERVRVCPLTPEQTVAPPATVRPSAPSKIGRPETKSLLVPILRELMKSEQFRIGQRKSQFDHLRRMARKAHPETFIRASQPSDDTMRAVMRELGLLRSIS